MWNSGWDDIFRSNEWGKYPSIEVVRFVARNFYNRPERKAVRLLEVGCGTGANLWFMAREGFDAYGIDGSKVAIDRLNERFAREGLKAVTNVGDVSLIPYENGYFDGVIDCECLYANTVPDTKRILAEIHRVLKPGGVFFSMTFMAGTSEDALHKGYGFMRFMAEEEIQPLYGAYFNVRNIGYLAQNRDNGKHLVKEWLIDCVKE